MSEALRPGRLDFRRIQTAKSGGEIRRIISRHIHGKADDRDPKRGNLQSPLGQSVVHEKKQDDQWGTDEE